MPRGREKVLLAIAPGGVREDLNPAALPDGALLASNNWLTRRGVGAPRPGYELLGSALAAGDRIIGFGSRGSPAGTTAFVVHTLTVAKDVKDNSYYCKTTAMPGVFKISTTVAEGLNKKLDDLRNKKLFDFGWSDPQKLEVRDGEVRLVIEKQKEKWVRADQGNKELPSEKVQSLIDNLRNLSSKAFTADEAAAQAKYGLGKPVAEAKVTSDEGKRVERVLVAAGPESKYYTARDNEPATYEIEKTAYEDFQKALRELKDAPPPPPAKK